MREAYEALREGKVRQAATIYEDLLKRFSGSLDEKEKGLLSSEAAGAYYAMGDYDGAQQHAERAIQFNGGDDQAHTVLGRIAVSKFNFARAREHFLKIGTTNPARYLGLCLVAVKLRHTTEAANYLREGSAYFSRRDPEYGVLSAYVQLLQGQAKEAVMAARQLLSTLPKDIFLLLLVGEIFMTGGQYGEARAVADKVKALAPDNDQLYALKANAEYSEENWTVAESLAQESLRLNPQNAYAQTVMMKCLVRKGDYLGAEELGKDILRRAPEYALGHANLGDVYFVMGQYDLARLEYEQTEELMDSLTKGARLRKARMQFIDGNYVEAAGLLTELIEGYHTYYDDAMCDLLLCYDRLDNKEGVESVLDKMELRKSFYQRTQQLMQKFVDAA